MVNVRVYLGVDIFVIRVPLAIQYSDLMEKIGRKVRLCGPRRSDDPLRVKCRDEEGDLISLRSTEDLQMVFEMVKPGGSVILYAT